MFCQGVNLDTDMRTCCSALCNNLFQGFRTSGLIQTAEMPIGFFKQTIVFFMQTRMADQKVANQDGRAKGVSQYR
jgi:hypothetical protein